MRLQRLKVSLLFLVLTSVVTWIWIAKVSSPAPEQKLRELRRKFARREYNGVLLLAEHLEESGSISDAACVMAGEAATKVGEYEAAIEYYRLVRESSEKYPVAQLATGELLRDQGRVSAAERSYQAAIAARPRNSIAHSRLAMFAMSTGRAFKARHHLEVLLQQRTISWSELCRLAATERASELDGYFVEALQENGSDELVLLGAAERFMHRGEFDRCDEILKLGRTLVSSRVTVTRLKCCLLDGRHPQVPDNLRQQFQEFESPEQAEGLFILGATLEANKYIDDAMLCFARCLQFGDHLAASQHLLTLLTAEGFVIELAPLRKRVELLGRVHAILDSLQPDVVNPVAALELANIMMELGRHDEAAAWFAAAGRSEPFVFEKNADLDAAVASVLDACLERHPDLSAEVLAARGDSLKVASGSLVQRFEGPLFRDIAHEVGISFQYFESPDEETEGRRMFEFTGGGVGVLDVDNDSWPDLYFAQGTDWPASKDNHRWTDVLYRNLRGERARDVSVASGISETAFGQGVCCGDLNHDGFTDLVVANIGANSYWLNQGDGTFLPLTEKTPEQDDWTTSCAIADINADGLPDIFEVNYVSGPEVYSRVCNTPVGPRVCSPQAFQPTADRLLLNSGSGTFVDISKASGLEQRGNGLGVIIADLDADPMPEIFVANDATPNCLWDVQAIADGLPVFREVASERGVAVSSEGKPQACMGIAVGDFNRDGNSDLFVTNYFNESNSLYLFDSLGFASDRSAAFDVRRTSIKMLGFGCQAIDVGGNDDIFVVNGDIDDFAHENRPFVMRPQLLIGEPAQQSFREAVSESPECVLNSVLRGRAVAKCDWDRDGRWEFIVTRLDEPAMLLSHARDSGTPRAIVSLVGINAPRQATETSVRDLNGSTRKRNVGGGFMASNQIAYSLPSQQASTIVQAGVETKTSTTQAARQVIVESRTHPYDIPE